MSGGRRWRGRRSPAGSLLPRLRARRAVLEGLWLRYTGVTVEEDVVRERRRRLLQTVSWFLLTLLLALFIPDIGKVISVIGGLAACFIFVFPGTASWGGLLASYLREGGDGMGTREQGGLWRRRTTGLTGLCSVTGSVGEAGG